MLFLTEDDSSLFSATCKELMWISSYNSICVTLFSLSVFPWNPDEDLLPNTRAVVHWLWDILTTFLHYVNIDVSNSSDWKKTAFNIIS